MQVALRPQGGRGQTEEVNLITGPTFLKKKKKLFFCNEILKFRQGAGQRKVPVANHGSRTAAGRPKENLIGSFGTSGWFVQTIAPPM